MRFCLENRRNTSYNLRQVLRIFTQTSKENRKGSWDHSPASDCLAHHVQLVFQSLHWKVYFMCGSGQTITPSKFVFSHPFEEDTKLVGSIFAQGYFRSKFQSTIVSFDLNHSLSVPFKSQPTHKN